ncbi:SCP2 sterol-binding domain-containing protein [Palleronia sediminis]|uniref:SCP2 sterol-binding domain-containing protein n=1 Tax=Palleronia sediminis TaxID=2547833 RepID=A0A4V3BAJ9_9RHOB|nr:SCP2 sterol-binding domain-containing protein [Palleronia sediminis]TDL83579.1 SCP2 sterol-binding domain-containing protein [Palleronia sediminis]
MSETIDQVVAEMNRRIGGSYDGSAKFVIEGEGAVTLDASGARAADDPARVTLTAGLETFRRIFEGDLDPTTAFMTGRLGIEGDMGEAMRLARAL